MMFAEAKKRAWDEVSIKADDVVYSGKRYDAKVNFEPTKKVNCNDVKTYSKLTFEVKRAPNKQDTDTLAYKETPTKKLASAKVPYPLAGGARAP